MLLQWFGDNIYLIGVFYLQLVLFSWPVWDRNVNDVYAARDDSETIRHSSNREFNTKVLFDSDSLSK